MPSYDAAWLAEYLRTHPEEAARMGQPPVSIPDKVWPEEAVEEPEGVLLGKVRRCALDSGWAYYHPYDSRRSDEGYPDCTLAKPGRLIFAELKDRRSKPSHAQEVWLDILRHTLPGVEVYVWRPADWENIVKILLRK